MQLFLFRGLAVYNVQNIGGVCYGLYAVIRGSMEKRSENHSNPSSVPFGDIYMNKTDQAIRLEPVARKQQAAAAAATSAGSSFFARDIPLLRG